MEAASALEPDADAVGGGLDGLRGGGVDEVLVVGIDFGFLLGVSGVEGEQDGFGASGGGGGHAFGQRRGQVLDGLAEGSYQRRIGHGAGDDVEVEAEVGFAGEALGVADEPGDFGVEMDFAGLEGG